MIPTTEEWVEYAVCRSIDPELFFPEIGQDWRAPQRVCASSCPVRLQCLDAAMRYELGRDRAQRFGVAGGLTPKKRRDYEPQWLAEQQEAAA